MVNNGKINITGGHIIANWDKIIEDYAGWDFRMLLVASLTGFSWKKCEDVRMWGCEDIRPGQKKTGHNNKVTVLTRWLRGRVALYLKKIKFVRSNLLCYLYSAVNVSETPAVATVEKKEYVYETKEEAKQAFKELLREKAC